MRKNQRIVGAVLLSALAISAVGCSAPADSNEPDVLDAADSSFDFPDLSGQSLVYASYGGTLQEAEEKAFFLPFADGSGMEFTSDGPVDNSKIKSQVETGNIQWDMVNNELSFVSEQCGVLFEEIDTSIVTNLEHVDEQYKKSSCFLPTFAYSQLLMYNPEKFDAEPASWVDFFDTEKYPGPRAAWMYDSANLITIALLADGVAPEDLYPLDLDRAFAKLDTIKDLMRWAEAPGQVTEQILADEVDLALAYSGRGYDAIAEGSNWKVAWGATPIVEVQGVAILKGTKNLEAAQQAANYILSEEAQTNLPNFIAYSPIRTGIEPDVDAAKREFLMLDMPEGSTILGNPNPDWWKDNRDIVETRFTEWQAG